MSTEQLDATNAVKEFLTCLEVLMEEVDYHQDLQDWFKIDDSIRHKISEPVRPDHEEVTTAMWQVVELGMALLEDHLAAVAFLEQLEDHAKEAEQVGEIIRPQLYVPGQ